MCVGIYLVLIFKIIINFNLAYCSNDFQNNYFTHYNLYHILRENETLIPQSFIQSRAFVFKILCEKLKIVCLSTKIKYKLP